MKRPIEPNRCVRGPARPRETAIPSLLATLINKTAHRYGQDAYTAHRAVLRALAARLLADGMSVEGVAREIAKPRQPAAGNPTGASQ